MKNYVIRFLDASDPVHFDEIGRFSVADKYGFNADALEFGEIELRDDDGWLQGWVITDGTAA